MENKEISGTSGQVENQLISDDLQTKLLAAIFVILFVVGMVFGLCEFFHVSLISV